MSNLTNLLLIYLSTILVCTSCQQSKLSVNNNQPKTFFESDCEHVRVTLWIQHNSGIVGNKGSSSISAGCFKNESADIGPLVINEILLSKQNHYAIQFINGNDDLFGNRLNISYDNQVTFFNNPKILDVTYEAKDLSKIAEGALFKWTPDTLSDHIEINFWAEVDAGRVVSKTLVVKDQGNFTIPDQWLEPYPDGTLINLTFTRGKKTLIPLQSGKPLEIFGFSRCSGDFFK